MNPGMMIENRNAGHCPFCGESVDRDELSLKEFSISGICQYCQDAFFGGN